MLERLRSRLARMIAPPRRLGGETRMYASARSSRLSSDRPTWTGSADSELSTSLTSLRNGSRALIRDNAYAKRARSVVVNNVVGTGIGLQAQVRTSRGDLNKRANSAIETAWDQWSRAKRCHTGGKLHFCDFERALMAQVFEAGEVFVRKHYRPFGDSSVPLALELIEAERIADEFTNVNPPPGGGIARMGIEVDGFGRPLYYWIRERHPGELRGVPEATTRLERVPADQIIHLHLCDRWPQTRGEPWLHAVLQRVRDIDGYSEAEIVAARAAACYMGFIESPEVQVGDTEEAGQKQRNFEPGMIDELAAGEKFTGWAPNRPNPAMEAFIRALLREVAAGVGVSYEALSRDYSQSNYSSSRLSLLDDRELWRVLQGWFVRSFRAEIHYEWLRQAVLARVIPGVALDEYASDPAKFEAVRFKPRGWAWIDPTKEVAAYKEAVRCGFTTVTDVIAATAGGQDIEDVLETRRAELDMMEDMGLAFESDPAFTAPAAAPTPAQPAAAAGPGDQGDAIEPVDDSEAEPAARILRLAPNGVRS